MVLGVDVLWLSCDNGTKKSTFPLKGGPCSMVHLPHYRISLNRQSYGFNWLLPMTDQLVLYPQAKFSCDWSTDLCTSLKNMAENCAAILALSACRKTLTEISWDLGYSRTAVYRVVNRGTVDTLPRVLQKPARPQELVKAVTESVDSKRGKATIRRLSRDLMSAGPPCDAWSTRILACHHSKEPHDKP